MRVQTVHCGNFGTKDRISVMVHQHHGDRNCVFLIRRKKILTKILKKLKKFKIMDPECRFARALVNVHACVRACMRVNECVYGACA